MNLKNCFITLNIITLLNAFFIVPFEDGSEEVIYLSKNSIECIYIAQLIL